MEFFRVLFPAQRGVRLNGAPFGTTNRTLPVQAGTHRISLDGNGFTPPSVVVTISGTSQNAPQIVRFSPAVAAAAPFDLDGTTAAVAATAVAATAAVVVAVNRRRAAKKKAAKKAAAKKASTKKATTKKATTKKATTKKKSKKK